MRVVLDTNVLLVSIPFGKPYYPIFNAFLNGAFELCVTTDILDEYAEKLHEKYALRPSVAENTLAALENIPFPSVRVISADAFLEILTGNRL
jgi:predicted nucleic acid-binding protein